ncbi:MAG: RNA polymerase sigma-70 factor [Mangrovibacterium sp.]|nr:RNA polymerase sigma-70 factor [Mangrovibacterium sp.]
MEKQTDELFIVQRMIEGDRKAFRYFFEKYYAGLCNFVNIYVHDTSLAEEIVQDIFVCFWENKTHLKITHSVKSYLFTASKYRSLKEIRNQNTRKRILKGLTITDFDDQTNHDEFYFDTEEFRSVLNAAVEDLPPKCKEIFLMGKVKNLSHREIAERLNISAKTVENQITIALKKLRAALSPYRKEIFLLFLLHFYL